MRSFTRGHVLDEHGVTLEIDSFQAAPISTANEVGILQNVTRWSKLNGYEEQNFHRSAQHRYD